MAADKPGELLEHNDIIQNLNPPCEIADAAAWVKPGKIMRETTITTEGAIAPSTSVQHIISVYAFRLAMVYALYFT